MIQSCKITLNNFAKPNKQHLLKEIAKWIDKCDIACKQNLILILVLGITFKRCIMGPHENCETCVSL